MGIDIEKFRMTSSFRKTTGDYKIRESTVQQLIAEFDLYQEYAPNTHIIYINDDPTPVLATFQDVSDLEIRTDSKWMLTSLRHKVYCGDIFMLEGKKWMCIYDKEKNTSSCYKVKVQPCNYQIKIPLFKSDATPFIYNADGVIMTYLTDMKDFKQPFPTEVGTTFVSVQYNEWTKQIIRECRIWLYDSAFIVAGVDFTNIDFYQNKGFLKWTVRPCNTNSDLDNVELGVCDYYKYFQRSNSGNNNSNPPSIPKEDITLTAPYMQISQYQGMEITAISEPIGDYQFLFEGDTMSCTLRKTSNNTCMLKAGREIGIVTIKAVLTTDTSKYGTMRIVIN